MERQLSLSARPRTFEGLIGQQRIVQQLRGQYAGAHRIKALLLVGPTGAGKTSLARILSLSLQCQHQEFGRPCKACRAQRSSFDVIEVDVTRASGKSDLAAELEGAQFAPRMGTSRVYILDEVQQASDAAQSLLLRLIEDDSPDSTVFILCSTNPEKIKATIQGRCQIYTLNELSMDEVTQLVESLLKRCGSDLPVDRLVDALVERGVALPRHITQAVQKYVSGATPDEAALVEASTPVDTKQVCRSMITGDWTAVAAFLREVPASSADAVRLGCAAYLRKILLRETEVSDRTEAVARAIRVLCEVQGGSNVQIASGTAAALYTATAYFTKYKRGIGGGRRE